eukprot:CAMPEP_0175739542 /NCGR_PEP_ID=MMETSP0097-20121207/55055_1 /TAXON_ID=311494 /ORGANISM="Alexandrium monilatum, Strain CCMP3105" /LENGTH=66 /DNA_ID=CAMNT_0017047803 /DNA_START=28 /DNA_END=224 /DNA_ORIENTATION=-
MDRYAHVRLPSPPPPDLQQAPAASVHNVLRVVGQERQDVRQGGVLATAQALVALVGEVGHRHQVAL